MDKNSVQFSKEDKEYILELHGVVTNYVVNIGNSVREEDAYNLDKAMIDGKNINRKVKQFRSTHLNKLGTKQYSPEMSLIYTDILSAYRHIRDHAFNIAEVVAGEK